MELLPINRNVLIITPTQTMIDWVNSLDPDGMVMVLDTAHDSANVYLIRESDDIETGLRWLRKNFKEIFAEELFNWWTDDSDWPPLTWKNFEAFCHCRIHSCVYDTQRGGILYDL